MQHSLSGLAAFGPLLALIALSPVDAKDTAPEPVMVSSAAIDPAALKLATQIVDLGYPEDTREELFFSTMDQTVAQMRSAITPQLPRNDPGAIAILDEWIAEYTEESKLVLRKHIPSIMAGMTQAYATIFTIEELEDILAFVQTPSGKRYFELSPAVLGEKAFADANQRYMDESMAMLGPAQAELMSRLRQHMADAENEDTSPDT